MEVKVSGMENLDHADYDFINQQADKLGRKNGIVQALNLNIATHKGEGARRKFSICVNAQTDRGVFNSESSEWKLNIAVKEALKKLEKHMDGDLKRREK